MNKKIIANYSIRLFIACIGFIFLTGCVANVRKPQASLDNAEHHVFNGLKLIDDGSFDKANKEFDLALELDPEYSRAFYGRGIVKGHQAQFDEAFADMNKAIKFAKTADESALAYTGMMHLHLFQREKGWLLKVEENYRKALLKVKDSPSTHYYMGLAYKEATLFDKSAKEFEEVIHIDKEFVDEADIEYKKSSEDFKSIAWHRNW